MGASDGEADGPPLIGGFRHDPSRAERPPLAALLALLDFQDAAPAIERLRTWSLEQCRPTPGEMVVDVGSGSGTIVRRLAPLVGDSGVVVGVEPDDEMRAEAERRGTPPGARFLAGVAAALPFDDSSVDLLWCERVLQHLPDPDSALREFARVLRPGGRALLIDSDHASRVTSDVDPVVERQVLDTFLELVPNPLAARHLPRQIRDAGLRLHPDIGSTALIFPPSMLLEPIAEEAFRTAMRTGRISQQQMEQGLDRLQQAAREGVAFTAVTVFAFLARQPD